MSGMKKFSQHFVLTNLELEELETLNVHEIPGDSYIPFDLAL